MAQVRNIRGPKKAALKSIEQLSKIPKSGLSRKRDGKPKRTLRTAVNELLFEVRAQQAEHNAESHAVAAAFCEWIAARRMNIETAFAEWQSDPRFAAESADPKAAFSMGYISAMRDMSRKNLETHGVKFDERGNAIIESKP